MVRNHDGGYGEKKKLKNLWPIRTSDVPHHGRNEFMTQNMIWYIMFHLITTVMKWYMTVMKIMTAVMRYFMTEVIIS